MRITRTISTILIGASAAAFLGGCLFSSDKKSQGAGPEQVYHGYYAASFPSTMNALHLDSTYVVRWTASDSVAGSSVGISLFQGERYITTLTGIANNATGYTWSLPGTRAIGTYRFGSGSGYRLKFTCVQDTSKWDFGPPFSVYSNLNGGIGVTSPAAATETKLDSLLQIRWVTSGNIGSTVGILLYKDTALARTVATSVSNTGSYAWAGVKSSLGSGSDYHVRVYSTGDPALAGLSPAFRIASAYDGGYTVTYPRSGDTLNIGATSRVIWSVTGNPGIYANLSLYKDSTLVSTIYSSATAANDSALWSVPGGLLTSSKYRVKIASASDPGISAYSAYFTIKGGDPDEYESDDSLKAAKQIPVDGTVQQRTVYPQDVDWLRFGTQKGKRYLVNIRSGLSLYAYATDSVGTTVNSSQYGSNIQIFLNPAYSGKYHVRISPYSSSSSSSGKYTVSVMEYDSTQSAFPIQFSSPDAKTVWAAGSSYKIAWTPDSIAYGTSVNLSLYNDTVSVQSIGTYLSNSGEYTVSIPAGLATSPRYRIRIAGYNNSQVYAYSDTFTISGIAPDSYEPDNSKEAAKAIQIDGTSQSRNLTSGDQDWMKISATKGGRYLASIKTAGSIYAYAYVLDSLGVQVASQSGSQISLVFNSTYAGPYYLRIQQSGSTATGDYTVRVFGYDSSSSGFPVKFTAPDTSTVWAAGNAYSVTWAPDSLLYGTYVSLALYQDNTLIQSLASSASNSGTYGVSIPGGLASGKNYRIRMTSGLNSVVFGHSAYFTLSGVAPDSLEPNDSAAAAKPAPLNADPIRLSLSYRDKDWMRFEAKSQMLYVIRAISPSALPTTMRLYSGLGTSQLLSNSKLYSVVADTVNSIAWVCPADGVHSVSVEPYSINSTYTGAYSFEIRELAPADYKLAVPSPVAGAAFHGGEALSIQWNEPAGVHANVDIFLYSADGVVQTIAANVSAAPPYSFTIPASLAARSDYYVKVVSRLNAGINGSSGVFSIAP
jgi:hypothetical protein